MVSALPTVYHYRSLPKKGPMGSVLYIRLKLGGGPTLQASVLTVEHYIVRKVCATSWAKHLVLV